MQINSKIQIIMDQHDIEAAITAAIIQKLPHLEGVQLSIKLVAGRGESGHRAEVEATHESAEAVLPTGNTDDNAQDDKPPFVLEDEKCEQEVPEQEAIPASVESQQRPVFRRNGAVQEEELTKAEEPALQQAAPPKGGLFKSLTRPDNRNK